MELRLDSEGPSDTRAFLDSLLFQVGFGAGFFVVLVRVLQPVSDAPDAFCCSATLVRCFGFLGGRPGARLGRDDMLWTIGTQQGSTKYSSNNYIDFLYSIIAV
jgi:hypothetical protein